jgi:hypothetical protein
VNATATAKTKKPEKPTQVIQLENGKKALLYIYHTEQTIFRKQKVNGVTLRDGAGNPVLYSMTVPGTSLKISLENKGNEVKGIITSRSCCKPPDNFCRKLGTRIALQNAFRKDANKEILTKEDRRTIMSTLFSELDCKKKAKKNTSAKPNDSSIPEVPSPGKTKRPIIVKKDSSSKKFSNVGVVTPNVKTNIKKDG